MISNGHVDLSKQYLLTAHSGYLLPLVRVLCNKPPFHNNTFVSKLYGHSRALYHVQASSCCACPKHALHAPSNIIYINIINLI